ncbi:GNAT family N-acetyltransferase [Brevundimonas sp.]|uniref:GNAT family N-acetyltransferase n=1 Tax=Brevundimonas sp. TaxID=1871086 RepID=UPI002737AFD1|nr:GNAT family N-acetyltransferase [Brevundimonas sp.]MDP3802161.1 GNAT family N-acetyltransferase [Brevundimonas sp.]
MASVTIRSADPADAAIVHALMAGLAEHQGEAPHLAASPASLEVALGGDPPRAWCLLAWLDGRAVGYLSWTRPYGIWRAGDYLNLDDLYVDESARGRGVGEALMRRFAGIAVAEGLPARWEVKSDNLAARRFYDRLGALQSDKTIVRWSVAAMRAAG